MIIFGITKKRIGLFLDYKNNCRISLFVWITKKRLIIFGILKKASDYFLHYKKSVGLFFELQKKRQIIFWIKKSVGLFSGLKQKHRDYNPLPSMDWVHLQYCLLE